MAAAWVTTADGCHVRVQNSDYQRNPLSVSLVFHGMRVTVLEADRVLFTHLHNIILANSQDSTACESEVQVDLIVGGTTVRTNMSPLPRAEDNDLLIVCGDIRHTWLGWQLRPQQPTCQRQQRAKLLIPAAPSIEKEILPGAILAKIWVGSSKFVANSRQLLPDLLRSGFQHAHKRPRATIPEWCRTKPGKPESRRLQYRWPKNLRGRCLWGTHCQGPRPECCGGSKVTRSHHDLNGNLIPLLYAARFSVTLCCQLNNTVWMVGDVL
mmetsp:Transcript_118089/g.227732  ORF Transcript_118089/g.227732 Transcript_118089/m.227732 type:complete len:267 (+) Transcript_118089:253-1053(+)